MTDRIQQIRDRMNGSDWSEFHDNAYDDMAWLLERIDELEREKAVADAYEAGKKANDDIKNGRLRTFDSVDEMLASFNEPLEGGMDSDD